MEEENYQKKTGSITMGSAAKSAALKGYFDEHDPEDMELVSKNILKLRELLIRLGVNF